MLVLHTLGGVQVVGSGRMRQRRRELALLCYCAFRADEWVDRDELAALLWSVPSETQRAHSLRECLYRLPHHIRGLRFETRPKMLRLKRSGVQVDVHGFVSALEAGDHTRAAELYGGEFMKGFHIPGASAFSQWREETASKLRSLAQDAFAGALEHSQMRGDWRSAERFARTLTLLDPYDEAASAVHVRLLMKRGADVQARRELEKAIIRLRAVDREPGEVLAALQSGAGSTVDREWDEDSKALPLVGRASEFDRLRKLLTAAEKGVATGVVLDGHAGNGKTRLMQQVLRLALIRGDRVLQTTCGLFSSVSPYGAIRGLLRNLHEPELAMVPARQRAVVMEGLHSGMPACLASVGVLDQVTVFDAVASLFEALAEVRPLVLFFDDVHRIDGESAELLRFFRRRLRTSRILFAGALRSEARHDATVLSLLEPADFVVVPVGELDSAGVADLIAEFQKRWGTEVPARAAQIVTRRASGNPLFLLELLAGYGKDWQLHGDQQDCVPPSIDQFLAQKLAKLTPRAAETAAALAVLGGRSDAMTLERVGELGAEQSLQCIEELCAHGVVRNHEGDVEFVHEITRESVYSRMLPLRRRALHARAARALLVRRPIDLVAIASHFEEAGDRPNVVRYAAAAAVLAEKQYGPAKAERFWRLVAANGERRQVIFHASERLAACQFYGGKTHEAIQSYRQMLDDPHITDAKRVAFRARLESLLARHGMRSPEGACEELLRSALALPSGSDKLDAIQAAFSVAMTFDRRDLVDRFAAQIADAVHLAGSGASRFVIMMHLAERAALVGRFADAFRLSRVAETYGGSTVSETVLLRAFQAICCYLQGNVRAAADHYMHAARHIGTRANLPLPVRHNWSVLDVECARFSEAQTDLADCVEIAEASGNTYVVGLCQANLAWVALERGSSDLALLESRRALDRCGAATRSSASLLALAVAGLSQMPCDVRGAESTRRSLQKIVSDQDPFGGDLSYAYIFLARMAEREGRWAQAMKLVEKGIGLYAGRDFFCHGRLELEKARLLGGRDAEGALDLARAVRGRALEAEAVLMLNKSEALIRQLKRTAAGRGRHGTAAAEATDPGAFPGAGDRKVGSARANGSAGEQVVGGEARRPPTRLVAERSWSGRGTIVK